MLIETQYKERMQRVFIPILPPNVKNVTNSDLESLFFCDWSRKAQEFGAARRISSAPAAIPQNKLKKLSIKESKLYDELTDMKLSRIFVETQLEEYNLLSKTPMDLVVFKYMLAHLIRIGRIIKQPNGHVLLLGTKLSFI